MLHPIHLLVSDAEAGWRVEVLPHRAWRQTLLVPRQLCLFESLPCAEIRWYELPGFARLQARRLAPFERVGASAARRGGRLMLWLWDSAEVAEALSSAGLDARRFKIAAEALYLSAPPTQGEFDERASQCQTRGFSEGGAVRRSVVVSAKTPDLTVIRARPWGYDWLGAWDRRGGGHVPSVQWRELVNATALLAAGVMFVVVAYQGGGLLGSERAAQDLEAQLESNLTSRSEVSALSKALQADAQWVSSYAKASQQLDFGTLLEALRPVLEKHGVVLREFEASGVEVRFMALTVGGEIRLPELLADLAAVPGLAQVRLLQQDELRQATFALQVQSFFVPLHPIDTEGGVSHGQ